MTPESKPPAPESNVRHRRVPESSCFDPDIAAVAAAVMAAAAAPTFAPPAAFTTPATFANAAIPPTSIALRATVGFIDISCGTYLQS
ncbi:hypothetical protein Acr_11g0014700 [Actinidia rufa]|uniref:Uncharacterized protein n=1 Tax=Actinidia rufa TaxID=165716 RepID=A0A7J0FEN3_9ERIC|nr:hypothetical protein Acr_11g0014700 [Actinidia rufa]